MRESPGLKPAYFGDIKSFSKNLSILLESNRLNVLPPIGKSETGGKFLTVCYHPFYNLNTILVFFQSKGT